MKFRPALLLAACLACGPACAEDPAPAARYKLAETIPPGEEWHYALIDRHTPATPGGPSIDQQTMGEDQLADKPHAFVRAGLNAKLEQAGEEKALVEKYFAGKNLELKVFEVQLTRWYPKDSRYMNAAAVTGGGLLGLLIGGIMDGMHNRGNMQTRAVIHIVIEADGKVLEASEEQGYTPETLQTVLISRADAAVESLAYQMRAEARAREEAANPAPAVQPAAEEPKPAPQTSPPAGSPATGS